MLQITADKAILGNSQLQSDGTGILDRSQAVLLGQGEDSQDAANRQLALPLVELQTELPDAQPGFLSTAQQLLSSQWCSPRTISFLDRVLPPFLAPVLAQELAGLGIQQTHMEFAPLHVHLPPDPARRCAVVGRFDFHATIQVYGAF